MKGTTLGTYLLTGLAAVATPALPMCQASTIPTSRPAGSAASAASVEPRILYVATTGNDQNAGTSREAPLRTISAAAARAKPGTTVLVAGGTYREQVITRTGGTPGNAITFKSHNGRALIDGSRLPWKVGDNQNQGLIELRHPWIRLEGLGIVNSRNSGIVLEADHLTVDSCEIRDIHRHAISTDTGRQVAAGGKMIRDITIRNNRVRRATLGGNGRGQPISLIADGFVVSGNEVTENKEIGIDIWLGATHGEVVDNTVHNNPGQTGIYVDGATYVRIHRNRVYGNRHGIGVSSEDERYKTNHIWVYNNVVSDHDGAGCFIWDRGQGARDVLFAHNTLVGNKVSFRFAGHGNSALVQNNLSMAPGGAHFEDQSKNSDIRLQSNALGGMPDGFLRPAAGDFRLNAVSPAIDKGAKLPDLADDQGRAIELWLDIAGRDRRSDGLPDAGAYERQNGTVSLGSCQAISAKDFPCPGL